MKLLQFMKLMSLKSHESLMNGTYTQACHKNYGLGLEIQNESW